MRIVYLHQYFATPQMAGGNRSYQMARRLVAMGHQVTMITSDQSATVGSPVWRETIESGIRVLWTPIAYDNRMSYGRRILAFFRFAWRAATKAAKCDGEIVFATSTPLTIVLPAVYASKRLRCPMVFEVRDLWPDVPIAIGAIKNPLAKAAARWLERFAYSHASRIVALAPGMKEAIVSKGIPDSNVTVIPNGCDLDIFSPGTRPSKVRSENDWLKDRPLVVFAGTFGLVNGMEYLVRLAAAMARYDSDVRFVAIGTGKMFEATRQLAAELGVIYDSLFFLGQKSKMEVAAWIDAADITLALFTGPRIVWKDAVQNKFFDSLAAGTPVASNFDGWQSRIAEVSGAGLTLSASNYDDAAKALAAALSDRDWLRSAGNAARNLAESRFDRDTLAADLEKWLQSALMSVSASSTQDC